MRRLALVVASLLLAGCASAGYYTPVHQPVVVNLSGYVRSASLATLDGHCVAVLAYVDGQVSRLSVDEAVCANAARAVAVIEALTVAPAAAPAPKAEPAK